MTTTSALPPIRHKGPPLAPVAAAHVVLFLAGLYPVTLFGGTPHFPGPWESADTIAEFFRARPDAARLCAFLQFGSAMPLGIFTASAVSRLQFLGVRAAGTYIALFGGFTTALMIMASSAVLWTMTQPGIAADQSLLHALYWLTQGLGAAGFSVPFGLLIAGIAITAGLQKLLPKWIAIAGIAVAICGELTWLYMMWPAALPLVPLTRFPGFVWLIVAAMALPQSRRR